MGYQYNLATKHKAFQNAHEMQTGTRYRSIGDAYLALLQTPGRLEPCSLHTTTRHKVRPSSNANTLQLSMQPYEFEVVETW